MRRTILLLLVTVLTLMVKAQNTLNVYQKDGTVTCYAFKDKPEAIIKQTEVIIKTTKTEITIPLNTIHLYTFADGVKPTTGFVTTRLVNESNTPVKIFNSAGELVKTVVPSRIPKAKASDQQKEKATFTLADLPAGLYVIQNGSTTYKVNKK